ncbi:hypothetical protein RJ640_001942, partial [Escallonia rubra]
MDEIWERVVETALDDQTDVALNPNPRLSCEKLILSDNRFASGLEYLVEAGLESLRDLDLSNNRIQDINDLRPLAKLKLVSLDLDRIVDVDEDEESAADEEETETLRVGGANGFSRPSSHHHSNGFVAAVDVEEDEEDEGEEDEEIDEDDGDDEDEDVVE